MKLFYLFLQLHPAHSTVGRRNIVLRTLHLIFRCILEALPWHQREEMKISFPRVQNEPTTCHAYSHTLVPRPVKDNFNIKIKNFTAMQFNNHLKLRSQLLQELFVQI